MTNFLKLTEKLTNGETTIVLLNISCIKSIKLSERGVDTHIYMTDQKYYFVKESVDQIEKMLNSKSDGMVA